MACRSALKKIQDFANASWFSPVALILALIMSMQGCALVKSESGDEAGPGHSASAALPSPKWMTTRDALGVKKPIPAGGAAAEQLSKEPVQLTSQLKARCRTSQQVYGKVDLTVLISALYRDGVDPTVATEALVKADCGSVSEVVQGMVAKGGEPVVAAIVQRALLLAKPGAKWTIENAVSSGLERNAASAGRAGTEGTGSSDDVSLDHTKPVQLTNQLAARCHKSRQVYGRVELATLINEFYQNGVEPTVATEALIKADCGSVSEVVQGMVAEGGEPVRAAVVKQALPLAKPGTKWTIESAATAGLGNDAAVAGRSKTGGDRNVLDYVMGFFGAGAAETDDDFVVPYGAGIPGYGIYTFILLGGGSVQSGEQDWDRYRGLLRVVQGYVLAAETETPSSGLQRHVFVVPVRPDLRGASLEEQAVHALSARMRDALALYFDQTGRSDISDLLRRHTGPLLVSSLEPTLVPNGRRSVRMVTDLSDIGPEYLYAVVDAYDRPIPEDLVGLAESFDPIHLRLSEVFTIVEGRIGDSTASQRVWRNDTTGRRLRASARRGSLE